MSEHTNGAKPDEHDHGKTADDISHIDPIINTVTDAAKLSWVNDIIKQLWPFTAEVIARIIKEDIEPMIQDNLPSLMRSFKFNYFDLGNIPLKITSLVVHQGNMVRQELTVDCDFIYEGDTKFEVSVGFFSAGGQSLKAKGKMRFVMKPLLTEVPIFGGLRFCFLGTPSIDYDLTGLGSLFEIPGLDSTLRQLLESQIQQYCVFPNTYDMPLVPSLVDENLNVAFQTPEGVIRVHLFGCRKLPVKDSVLKGGKADPYIIFNIGTQELTSSVKSNNLNPEYDEWFELFVNDSNHQRLNIQIWDQDATTGDDIIGRVQVEAYKIKEAVNIDKWYQIFNLATNADDGEIHLEIKWCSLTINKDLLSKDVIESSKTHGMHTSLLCVIVDRIESLPTRMASANKGACSCFQPLINRLCKNKSGAGDEGDQDDRGTSVEPSAFMTLTFNEKEKDEKQKFTRVKGNSANPVFQQRFNFLVGDPEDATINFKVTNSETDRELGTLSVPISNISEAEGMEIIDKKWVLTDINGWESFLYMSLAFRVISETAT